MKFDKLVRDKIPEIILDNGDTPVTHVANEEEYAVKLQEKLQEEVDEYLKSKDPEELADILEVVRALASINGKSMEDIEELRKNKYKKRGGFEKKIILEKTS